MRVGQTYRLRIINIRADTRARLQLLDGDKPVQWKFVARDGADLPASQVAMMDANVVTAPGEIRDFEFTPMRAGVLKLRYGYRTESAEVPKSAVVEWVVR